jgi:hypothetical protein
MNLKSHFVSKSKEELIREIITLSKNFPIVQEYYSVLLGSSEEMLDKYKNLIKKNIFHPGGSEMHEPELLKS